MRSAGFGRSSASNMLWGFFLSSYEELRLYGVTTTWFYNAASRGIWTNDKVEMRFLLNRQAHRMLFVPRNVVQRTRLFSSLVLLENQGPPLPPVAAFMQTIGLCTDWEGAVGTCEDVAFSISRIELNIWLGAALVYLISRSSMGSGELVVGKPSRNERRSVIATGCF